MRNFIRFLLLCLLIAIIIRYFVLNKELLRKDLQTLGEILENLGRTLKNKNSHIIFLNQILFHVTKIKLFSYNIWEEKMVSFILMISICLLQDYTGSTKQEGIPILKNRDLIEFLNSLGTDEVHFAFGLIKDLPSPLFRLSLPAIPNCEYIERKVKEFFEIRNPLIRKNKLNKLNPQLEECKLKVQDSFNSREKKVLEFANQVYKQLDENENLAMWTDLNSQFNRCVNFLNERNNGKKFLIVISDGKDNINRNQRVNLTPDIQLIEIPDDILPESGLVFESLRGVEDILKER